MYVVCVCVCVWSGVCMVVSVSAYFFPIVISMFFGCLFCVTEKSPQITDAPVLNADFVQVSEKEIKRKEKKRE